VIRASKVVHAGHWSGVATDAVVLPFDDRHRRRLAMKGERGLEFLLDLPEATALRHGDGLVLEDGRMVEVRAKPEPLLVVAAKDAHHLARLAWHLGNRHVPAAIGDGRILIRPDHVLAAMLVGLGGEVAAIEAPFDPEGGAYSQGGSHGHEHHGHSPDHPGHRHDHM
jgi:urease accessory protein